MCKCVTEWLFDEDVAFGGDGFASDGEMGDGWRGDNNGGAWMGLQGGRKGGVEERGGIIGKTLFGAIKGDRVSVDYSAEEAELVDGGDVIGAPTAGTDNDERGARGHGKMGR